MTRILRLLLIAAVAWPIWQQAAAQEVKSEVETKSVKEMLKNDVSSAVSTVASDEIVLKTEVKSGNTLASPTKRGQKSSTGGKAPKAISTKADQVTVTPPSSATIEEWAITATFYYYNNGWQTVTDYSSYSSTPIQVAIDGNDIYISGLCPQFASAWIKGTISGTTATFPTGQYYGTNSSDSEFWFVGEDSNDQECDVVFNYNADAKKLTLVTAYINNKTAATGGAYYSYFTSLVLQKPEGATVCNGSANNEYVPVYGYWMDTQATESQMIYPKTLFPDLQAGDRIESITFYTYTSSTPTVPSELGTATVQVRMGETTETAITSSTYQGNRTNATLVYEGTLTTGSNTMTITFSEPYVYGGKNLIIDSYVKTGGSYAHCYWAGESAASGSSAYYRSGFTALDFLPKMRMVWTAAVPDVALDFETVEVGSSKTLNALVKNPESQSVTATVTTSAPFSVANTSITMTSGNNVIPVTFTPTDATVYNGTLTIDMNGVTTTIDLKGIGNVTGSPAALRDSTFFAGINYEWTDSEGTTHTSSLDEIATDPDQMIAMIREIYTNKTIPGNFTRGFTTAGVAEGDAVNYGGVGTISATVSSSSISYSYEDGYGWGIPGSLVTGSKAASVSGLGTYYYSYMNPEQYKPYNEGVTLLLVEMVDDFDKTTMFNTEETEPYNQLRDYIVNSIKSIRVVTEARRTGTGNQAGTLFKIDCDKMNKFYFMAKGQLRWILNSYFPTFTYNNTEYVIGEEFSADPCYIYNSNNYFNMSGFYDDRSFPLFYNMFEEFSPVANDATAAKADIYQDLINMDSFAVEHDCMEVPLMGHQFMMYGEDSGAADCQDVRDLMFFVPDYRMMSWTGRDNSDAPDYQKFMNYNATYAPTLGLYVIRQNEIQGAQVSGKEMYKLTLNWETNLDQFLPSDEQEFYLYQVITNDNGVEQYVPVYYMNSNGQYTDKNGNVVTTPVPIVLQFNPGDTKEYTEVYVAMQNSSQQVTYAIQGCDTGHFLSLQMSNKRDFIIPGLDDDEMIKLNDVTYYSRFNAQDVTNCYSNKLVLENNAIGINNNAIVEGENGTKLFVNRVHTEKVDGVDTPITETVATITFNSSSRTLTVTMDKQSPMDAFPAGKTSGTGAGYHLNHGNVEGNGSWSQSYNVVTSGDNVGNIVLNPALTIYDNFVVDVANNEHPSSYTYKVETNYPGAVYLVTNNGDDYTNGAVWYAWTWNTTSDGIWVKGRSTTTSGKYMFTPMKANVIFVRMNPSGAPSWDSNVAWNQTGDLVVIGETFTLNGWGLTGAWEQNPETHTAYSNDFRIPVYKTDSRINNVFTLAEVDGDETGYMELPENFQFDEKLQFSSKTEILRYDVYRWGETDARYIIDKVNGNDDEDDIAPDGIAGNQGTSYTVSMNEVGTEDYYTTSVGISAGDDNKWATFVDYIPNKQTQGTAYTYAPVVEAFTFGADVSGNVRTDYNTYGGPIKTAAMGKLAISVVEPSSNNPLMSTYTWEENGKKYAYYNIKLNIDTKSIPAGYEIYKIRAWREIDESLLCEQYEECEDRISDSYKFEELTYPNIDEDYVLGGEPVNLSIEGHNGGIDSYTGTFGAQKLRTSDDETGVIDELDACFFVRIYFTRTANLASKGTRDGALPADGQYYVVEASYDFVAEGGSDVPTGIFNLNLDEYKEVVGVKYYNPAGIESDKPFQGVNIMVTRYSDGSTTTRKVLK